MVTIVVSLALTCFTQAIYTTESSSHLIELSMHNGRTCTSWMAHCHVSVLFTVYHYDSRYSADFTETCTAVLLSHQPTIASTTSEFPSISNHVPSVAAGSSWCGQPEATTRERRQRASFGLGTRWDGSRNMANWTGAPRSEKVSKTVSP